MIKTIVFDMDGVLIDSETILLEGWHMVAAARHIPDIDATVAKCIGLTVPMTEAVFLDTYGKDFPYKAYKEEVSAYFHQKNKKYGLPVKPGVYELFDFLKGNGYRIGLASSTREYYVKKHMEMIRLYDAFDAIVCGDMVKHSKPDPDIYLKACLLLKTEPAECYAVEDAPNGIRSAASAGMKPIMVPDLVQPDTEIRKLAFQCFHSLLEVKAYLESLEFI